MLHEKGIDICLALLEQYSKEKKESEIIAFVPDVLKMISALAAHGKFAALFADRGGMQNLLAVPRVLDAFCGLPSSLFTIVPRVLAYNVYSLVHSSPDFSSIEKPSVCSRELWSVFALFLQILSNRWLI